MLAERMSRISSSPTVKVMVAAERLKQQGVDVVDFGAGEPDFATPEHAKAAAHAAIDANFTRYTSTQGILDLRRAICDRYKLDYGVDYAENEAIITAGGKQALLNAALALFGPGDEVITHAPYWPTIPEQIKLAEATPVIVRTHAEDGFTIHAESIVDAITPRTRGIVINSPCNPTGALVSEAAMQTIADAAAAKKLWVIVDLTYDRLIYDPTPHNLVGILCRTMRDRTVLCGSMSKAYAMTGWRCGWSLAPAEVTAAFVALQSHATSNVSSISQKTAVAAFAGPQSPVDEMLAEYRRRRDTSMDGSRK